MFVLNINISSNSMTRTIKDILRDSVRPIIFLSPFFLKGLKKAKINQKIHINVVVIPTLSCSCHQFIILMTLPLRAI